MAVPLRLMQQALSRYALSDFLSYGAYDAERGVFRSLDGRVGTVWVTPPQTGLNEATVKGLTGLYAMDLPEGTTIQAAIHGSPVVEPILDHYVGLRNATGHDSVQFRDAQRMQDFYLRARETRLISSTGLRPRDCNVYFSVTIPLEHEAPNGMPLHLIYEKLNGIEKLFQTCGFPVRRLTAYDLLCLLHTLLNPGHTWAQRPVTYDPSLLIKKQALRYDTLCQVGERAIFLDKQFVKCLTVQQFPEEWDGSRNRELIGSLMRMQDQITCPFWMSLNAVRLNTIKTMADITRKHVLITNQSSKGLVRLIPLIGKKKDNLDLMKDAMTEGSQPIGLYYQVLLYGETATQLEQYSQSVQSLYRTHEWMLQEDNFINMFTFLFSLPMNIPGDVPLLRDKLRRLKTMPTNVPAEIAPVVGDWKGYGAPVLMFTSRSGQVMSMDVFANPTGNFNICVAAKSGAGKSFLINELIRSYMATQGRVWMIDAGKSYEKLCEHLKGQFIQFSGQQKHLCLNPLSRVLPRTGNSAEEEQDRRDEIAMLKDVFAQMAAPTRSLSELEMAWLEQAILKVLEAEGQDGTPTSVQTVLRDIKDPQGRTKDLADMLGSFCKGGNYGSLFNGKNNLDFDRSFIVLELDGLDQLPELRSVVLLQLIMNIQATMYMGDRGQRKICGIDEAWDLLAQKGDQANNVSAFFNKAVRRVRKYNGSVVVITQGVNDFYDVMGKTCQALMENSDFVFLLKQKEESLASLKRQDRLILSPYEFELLRSVHRGDNYSEIYFMTQVGRGIGRLVVPRETQLAYTTNADELAKIGRYKNEGVSTEDAIQRIVEEERQAAQKKGLGHVA
jgi:conjugal transfer ATP-binding protein TraC